MRNVIIIVLSIIFLASSVFASDYGKVKGVSVFGSILAIVKADDPLRGDQFCRCIPFWGMVICKCKYPEPEQPEPDVPNPDYGQPGCPHCPFYPPGPGL